MKIFDRAYYEDLKTRHPSPSLVPFTLATSFWVFYGIAVLIGISGGLILIHFGY